MEGSTEMEGLNMNKAIKTLTLITTGLVVGVVVGRVHKRIKFIEKDTHANFSNLDAYLNNHFSNYDKILSNSNNHPPSKMDV